MPADYEPDPVDLWPENWPAWVLFTEVSGQWRRNADGLPAALDYTPLFLRMDHMRLADDDWDAMFQDIRALEAAALAEMRKPT